MDFLFRVNWSELLVPKMSVAEMVIRGIAVYMMLVLLLRVVLKRQAGKVALSDLLLVTVVGGICRNPLIADAYSLTDGLGVVVSVLGTGYAIDWLSYHSTWVHRLVHPQPVVLVEHGEIIHQNLANEPMTVQQLEAKLRGHGIADPAKVLEARLEGDGKVTVVPK